MFPARLARRATDERSETRTLRERLARRMIREEMAIPESLATEMIREEMAIRKKLATEMIREQRENRKRFSRKYPRNSNPPTPVAEELMPGTQVRYTREVRLMRMDSNVYSLGFRLRKEEDLDDLTVNQVNFPSNFDISQMFNCGGLLLCVAQDRSRLLLWNPCFEQTRSIGPRSSFHRLDRYALGYDKNRTHKILRFVDDGENHVFGFEIYNLSSDSWRGLDVTPDWKLDRKQRCASLKGDTYFLADLDDFFFCFDFTTERFGPRLDLPFHSHVEDTVVLSCVREEQLVVLYQRAESPFYPLEIWVTTMIEPKAVSWKKFLKLDKNPVTCFGHVLFRYGAGSFFIAEDGEEKAAVVIDVFAPTDTKPAHHIAFIIRDDGYVRFVSLGEALNVAVEPECAPLYSPPLVCSSSYCPCFVQI